VTSVVPESSAENRCTVSWMLIVVAVIRGELSACIFAGVIRVPRHLQLIVGCLWQYSERIVLGIIPVADVAT